MTNEEAVNKFIKDLKRLCKENEIVFKLKNTKSVNMSDGIRCAGYFDENELVTAKGSKDYFQILIHESCHMDQYLEKDPIWKNAKYCDIVDEWLAGKEKRNIESHIDKVKLMELDCEKRTVEKIKKYKLPVNVEEYTQKANCYVQFYNYLKITRRWPAPNNSPYQNENIWKNAPKVFMGESWYETLPDEILNLFIKYEV